MIAFEFDLSPLPDVAPWSGRWHWFALTDGRYRIVIDGEVRLAADYYVVRLWEDLLRLLPAVRDAVPPDLLAFVSSSPTDWAESGAAADAARSWWADHELDTGYLVDAPRLRMWRAGDEVTVSGGVRMPAARVEEAVGDLDRRLMAEMAARVADIDRDGVPAGVTLDREALHREHADRATWHARATARAASADWPAIRAGAALLLR